MNLLKKFTRPRKDLTSLLQEGVGQSHTAFVFSGEGVTLAEEYSKPALALPKKYFDPHSVKPDFCNTWRRSLMCYSCHLKTL